jgi:pilus assembly protein Flp/PilA
MISKRHSFTKRIVAWELGWRRPPQLLPNREGNGSQAYLGQSINLPDQIYPLRNSCAKDNGAIAIKYGLIAAGISVAIIAVVQATGSSLNTTFTSVSTALK